MTFPVSITSNVEAYHGLGGPFCNSAGTAVYVFGRLSSLPGELQAFKATDPSTSWAGVGTNPVLANTLRQIGACQFGDTIHVVTRDAAAANSNQLRYHAFDMSTDTWTTTNELVKTTYTMAGAVDTSIVTITVRNSGAQKVVSYEGPQVLADIQRSRIYIAQNRGAGWSADIALGGGGNAHWQPQEAVTGAGNRTHFFILDHTNEDLYQRTLDSAYALEALPAAFDTTTSNQDDEMVQRAVAYSASAGGTVVVGAYFNSYAPDINAVRFTSVDTPSSLTINLDITGAVDPIIGLARRTISLAADGNTVYSVFIASDSKLYVQSSQDAGAWTTPALFLDSAVDGQVFTNIYTRGGSRKLGICYAATDIRYTEYTLNIAPSVMTDAPDHFSASGYVKVSGRMSATDVVGTFSATGYVPTVIHIGRMSATDVVGTLSATGYVVVSGRLSATAAADLFSASGTVGNATAAIGRLSATGATDIFSASAHVLVRGRVSATDVGNDIFSISGTTITPIHGSATWTMRPDIFVGNPRQPAGLTPGTLSNAGGGAGANNKENVAWPTDLWDAREAYLLSLYPEGPTPVLEVDDTDKAWQEYEDRKKQIEALTSERAHTIIELRESPDVKTMKVHGAHIKELTAKIATLTGKQDFARFMRH